MDKTVLLVAFHFPPAAMGSGHLRTLGFARYLPEQGWKPIVLSARAMAYPHTAPIEAGVIPPDCQVHRAPALDVSRHFALAGKYPGFLARPDRWSSWWPAAVAAGLHLIRRHHVDAIWSTYPIMTAHCIAHTLNRLSGVPWIADFRDPVSSSVGAENPYAVVSQQRWELRVLQEAARVVFTTPSALRDYSARYSGASHAGRLAVIQNGFDDDAFTALLGPHQRKGRPTVLVHSGMLYADGRNPSPFFAALAQLKTAGSISTETLRVVLRASDLEPMHVAEIQRLGLAGIVDLAPPVSNAAALREQAGADGLLLFQGSRYDRQIPAKVYEYLRTGRPIFALVSKSGDTAALLCKTGGAELVQIDDVSLIANRLAEFIAALSDGRQPVVAATNVQQYSRKSGAALLASMLNAVTDGASCNFTEVSKTTSITSSVKNSP